MDCLRLRGRTKSTVRPKLSIGSPALSTTSTAELIQPIPSGPAAAGSLQQISDEINCFTTLRREKKNIFAINFVKKKECFVRTSQ